MSTQHDSEKERKGPSQASQLPGNQAALQEERIFPGQVFPQAPKPSPRPRSKRWLVVSSVIVGLVLILSLGAIFIPGLVRPPGSQIKPTPTSPGTQMTPTSPSTPLTVTPGTSDITPAPAPGVVLGPQVCPAAIGNPAYWDAIIGTNNGDTILTLKNVEPGQLIASPVMLEGTGSAFEAVIGRAVVYDHLYNDIGHAQILGTNGMGISSYSTKVVYTSSFHQGVQEGVVAVFEANGGISDEAFTAVMRKVMLNPEPGVALGPLPCPDAVKDPAYWNPFISAPPNPRVAEQVTCGNLLGKPTLQAMVVAREIVVAVPPSM